jgi:hypothetical protein
MAHTRKAATAATGCYQRISKKQNKQREEGRRIKDKVNLRVG